MEVLLGVVLCLFVQGLFLLGRRMWRKTLPSAVPQPPPTAAQMVNARVFDEERRHHPQIVSARFQRRTRRGPRRPYVEDEFDEFEQ